MGTWQTFDVMPGAYAPLQEVLSIFQNEGGRLIDSSPMYGKAETVIGDIVPRLQQETPLFMATKVWTQGAEAGRRQMEDSFRKMKCRVIDLMQIHNLVDWKTHLPLLRRWKEEGRIRYIGLTHYQDSSHEALEAIISTEAIDFVQFNYSIFSRHAEQRLLPHCADLGVATLINRPFGEGSHFQKVRNKTLPTWAADWNISSWGSFFLKYILAHPAVTCVIPATGNPAHARLNMDAGEGPLPDEATRQKMIRYL
jgi:diketogulonate reductase-like aldo/keto reductase